MAIVVPFIASAMGATAVQAAMVSVAFAVTGISAKIDKAASKVFGKDLVKIGNIAGAVYGAWNGGFSLDPAKEALGIGAAATNTAQQGFRAAEIGAQNASAVADAAGATAGLSAGDAAGAYVQPSDYFGGVKGYQGGSLLDSANMAEMTGLPDASAAAQAGLDTAQAARQGEGLLAKLSQPVPDMGVGVTAAPANDLSKVPGLADQTSTLEGTDFFSKLKTGAIKGLTDPKVMAGMVQGAAGSYDSAQERAALEKRYQEEKARRDRLANLGLAGYRQTA